MTPKQEVFESLDFSNFEAQMPSCPGKQQAAARKLSFESISQCPSNLDFFQHRTLASVTYKLNAASDSLTRLNVNVKGMPILRATDI